RADVLGADEDDAHAAQLPDGCVQRVRDPAEVLADEVLDVAAVARLRPAALVVLPRRLLGVVGQLDELAAAQAVDLAPLAPDERDENALAAADEPRERREVQVAADLHLVVERIGGRDRGPEVVERRREYGDAADAVAVEVVVEPAADPLHVRLPRLARP